MKTNTVKRIPPQLMFKHTCMQSFNLFDTIYLVVNLLPLQVVHENNSFLLHIILLCIKTPQTRLKRFLSKKTGK